MARMYERYGSRIQAQASSAISANNFSNGAQTLIDKAVGQNADGAQWFDVYINVTTNPSGTCSAEIWITGSSDGSDESAYEYALTAPVTGSTTDQYHMGTIYTSPREFKAKIKAITYAFTATLYIVPVHFADT